MTQGSLGHCPQCCTDCNVAEAKKTRTELPSCEAIDVRKLNIGSIVRPVSKFKAGKNLKG